MIDMVSTGKLRVLSSLSEGSVERFEPTINDVGRVEYTEAKDSLTHRDGSSIEALNSLAERGLLHKEYTSKTYVCPSCQVEGMQYITACPFCKTTHSVRTTVFEHESCGYTAESTDFERESESESYRCPECDTEFDASELKTESRYLCKDCNESFENPSHRLWCLECLHLCPPEDSIEQTLYEYELTDNGKSWYETQVRTRDLLADELETRGFNVSIDTTIQTDDEESYSVHIHGKDDLLGQQIVADIHSTADADKLRYISAAAQDIGAQPILFVTDGSPSRDILQIAPQFNVMILGIDRDGSIERYQSADEEYQTPSTIFGRLSSAVGLAPQKKT